MNITASEYAAMEQRLAELCREQERLGSAFNGLTAQQIVEMSANIRDQIDEVMITIFDDLLLERETWKAAFPDKSFAEVLELAELGQKFREKAESLGAEGSPALTVVTSDGGAGDLAIGGDLKGTGYAGSDPTPEMVEALEAQLTSLYTEWEILGQHFPGQDADAIVAKISSQVARLEALYRQVA